MEYNGYVYIPQKNRFVPRWFTKRLLLAQAVDVVVSHCWLDPFEDVVLALQRHSLHREGGVSLSFSESLGLY